MLGSRRRRRPNIGLTLGQCLVFPGWAGCPSSHTILPFLGPYGSGGGGSDTDGLCGSTNTTKANGVAQEFSDVNPTRLQSQTTIKTPLAGHQDVNPRLFPSSRIYWPSQLVFPSLPAFLHLQLVFPTAIPESIIRSHSSRG